jgi:hypothetical protein
MKKELPPKIKDKPVDYLSIIKARIFKSNFEGLNLEQSNRVRRILLNNIAYNKSYIAAINELMEVRKIEKPQAELIARTEIHELRSALREEGFKQEDPKEKNLYVWMGPTDKRTTKYCRKISSLTKDGVDMSDLKRIIKDNADPNSYMEARPFSPHIGCRHIFIRKFK